MRPHRNHVPGDQSVLGAKCREPSIIIRRSEPRKAERACGARSSKLTAARSTRDMQRLQQHPAGCLLTSARPKPARTFAAQLNIDFNSQHERPGAYIRPFYSRSPSAGGVTTAERARRTEAPTPPLERTRAAAEATARASIRETRDQHRTAAQARHFTVCSLQTTFAVRTQAVQSPPRKAHDTAAI